MTNSRYFSSEEIEQVGWAKEALTRAWEAESKLAGIADVLNQELRENGGDRFQISPRDDIGLAIRRLVDCVREKK